MKLDPSEIAEIAEALAPRVADILERRLSDRPEWAMSVSEAAVWANVPESVVRDAIRTGRLPCVKIGRSIRIRRRDLFHVRKDNRDDDTKNVGLNAGTHG